MMSSSSVFDITLAVATFNYWDYDQYPMETGGSLSLNPGILPNSARVWGSGV